MTSGWTFGSGPFISSIERDTTTAAVGAASAHVLVPATTPWSYATVLRGNGTLAMTAGVQYSATFWAKAATPRTIWVAAANPGPGALTVAPQALTTEWRHYQVALISPSSGIAELQFQFGKEAGDVWLDDVHFQAGATSVYRRDFQNGIVLVNPSSSTLDVPLEREYRRITGVVDPVVNDGSRVTVVTIPPSDARFLIGTDQIPPRAVTDLRRIP